MCGIVAILGRHEVAPLILEALKRLEYRGYDSAGIATRAGRPARPPPRRRQAHRALRPPGRRTRSAARPASATPAGRRTARPPSATPTRIRPAASPSSTTASSRTTARSAPSSRPRAGLRDRDRHRGRRPALRPRARPRHDPARGRPRHHRPARRRLRPLLPLRGRGRPPDRRPPRLAARHRLRRRRDVRRLRRAGARAAHPPRQPTSRRATSPSSPATSAKIFDAHGRAGPPREAPARPRERLRREGPLQALHGQGDARAAERPRRRARALPLPRPHRRRDPGRHRLRRLRPHRPRRLRHRPLRLPRRALLVRDPCAGCRSRSRSPPSSATASRRSTPRTLGIFVSQSGETADTLAALRYVKDQGSPTVAVVNVETSTIAREAGTVLPILAGPEIGVASTKAFTCQLAVLACLAIAAGRQRGILDAAEEARLAAALATAPGLVAQALGARAADRRDRPRARPRPGRALPRPRPHVPARARRRAEAQGDQLHPRRRLRVGRAQARPDRAGRRPRRR